MINRVLEEIGRQVEWKSNEEMVKENRNLASMKVDGLR